jgi:periplasmic divalent cation tolerance protein
MKLAFAYLFFHGVEKRSVGGMGSNYTHGGKGVAVAKPRPAGYSADMNTETGLVMTTFPDSVTAAKVLDGLLENRLAACVQTMPIQSAYRWKGTVNRESEVLALIKTKGSLYPEAEAFIKARHPYETPEIVLIPITAGFAGYLQWINGETQ